MVHATRDERSWEDSTLEPIAIVGMACHLPGEIRSPSALWDLLKAKGSVQTPKVPSNRFNIDAHYHPNLERPGSFNVLGGYFLSGDLADFDPTFFNITPIEAMWLDPQQRKIIEVAYECLESAGATLESVSGSNTAVFVGSFTADYQQMSIREPDFRHNYAATGVDPGIISNRIGNVFNLRGPSFTINTACSSSVYAIHNACHALRARDCEAAIAGGVNLILTVDQHMNTAKLGILSPTSTCHTFDASADGYGRAEGAGALYLKRLSDAIRDGDPIRGVIRSSFVNTNGKVDGMGITHPSVEGQSRVLRNAYKRANLDPTKTAYAECHGTGTPVGDPIEVRAIASAMNDNRSKDKPLLVGAVKANIGHSEAASGIFAVMKGALMTEAGIIPGVAGFKNLNPNIKESEWNVKVNVNTIPWPSDFPVRRASVSSFGYGGTNGHVIVEAIESLYPWYQHGKPKSLATYNNSTSRPLLITLSAHDKTTLTRNIEAHAKVADQFYLADLAYTLNVRRTRFAQRAYTVAYENKIAEAFETSAFKTGTAGGTAPKIGFVFTGQGAQWAGMGVEAFHAFPSFRETIQNLDRVLQRLDPAPQWTLEEVLLAPKESSRLAEAEIAQPVCTAIQIAIVDLFEEWEIKPTVTVGHSSGEIAAAYAAGLVSAPEAIIAAFYRGLAVKQVAPAGSMLAVGLGVSEVEPYLSDLGDDVVVACENSPNSVTLSGTAAGIAAAKERFDLDKIFARELRTGKAYHSQHMNAVAPLYEKLLSLAYYTIDDEDLAWRQERSRMISSVTGEEFEGEQVPFQYWSENLRNRVRFNSAVTTLGNHPELQDVTSIIEIGPHSALAGPFKQISIANKFSHFKYIASFVRNNDSAVDLLKTAGELVLHNYPVDLEKVNEIEESVSGATFQKRRKPLILVDLPTYQWNYERKHWYEPRLSAEQRAIKYPRHDVLGSRIVGLSDRSPVWKNQLRHRDVPWFKDHSLGGSAVFPAAGHLSMAIEALRQVSEEEGITIESVTLRDIDIKTALVIPDKDDGIEVQFRLSKQSSPEIGNSTPWYAFAVESIVDGIWTTHCQGRIAGNYAPTHAPHTLESPVNVAKLNQRVPGKRWYDAFHRVGFQYDGVFQPLQRIRTNGKDRHAAASLHVSTESGVMVGESRYLLHPATIDACLQLIIISINRGLHKEMPWGVVPVEMEEITVYGLGENESNTEGNAVAWTDYQEGRYFNTNTKLQTQSGKVVLDVKNLKCVAYEAAVPQTAVEPRALEPYMQVTWNKLEEKEKKVDSPLEEDIELGDGIASVGLVDANATTNGTKDDLSILSLNTETTYLQDLVTSLKAGGLAIENVAFTSANLDSTVESTNCHLSGGKILVNDIEGTLLLQASKDPSIFETLKKVVTSGLPIVWLTAGANQGANAFAGMPQGFLRAVRSEQAAAKITLLDVDAETPAELVSKILPRIFESVGTKDSGAETEYWLKGGVLTVPRIVPNERLNSTFVENKPAEKAVLEDNASLKGEFKDGELVFQKDEKAETELAHDELEIQVVAAEHSQAGSASNKTKLSFVLGIVTRRGDFVPHAEVGETVIALAEYGFSTKVRVKDAHVAEISYLIKDRYFGERIFEHDVAYTDILANLPVLASAVSKVKLAGGVRQRDNVVLLPASEDFTDVVVGLKHVIGFNLAIITPDVETKERYTAKYSLPSTAFIAAEENDKIRAFLTSTRTSGRVGTIAIGHTFNSLAQDVWRLLPEGGRFILNEGPLSQAPDHAPFTRGVSLKVTGVETVWKQQMKAENTTRCFIRNSFEVLRDDVGFLKKKAVVHDVSDITTPNLGENAVLEYRYGKSSIKIQPSTPTLKFSKEAAYILVGCLGGLGRSLTTFMRSRGAQNFIFISRSGADKPDAALVVKELVDSGANVQVYRGDASNADDVSHIISSVKAQFPIKGVVHAAMVLQDGMLETLSHERFKAAIDPKVLGALNLHNILQDTDLDFFVMTSSISAVLGNPGQTNYSAANSYLDALALHRRNQGLAATSLALPMVLDVGVVSENEAIEQSLLRKGMYGIDEREMLESFEVAMSQPIPTPSSSEQQEVAGPGESQIVLGLDPQLLAQAVSSSDNVDAYWYNDSRLSVLRSSVEDILSTSSSGSSKVGGSFISSLTSIAASSESQEPVLLAIAQHLISKCSSILMLPVEDFELEGRSIASYGLDSMIGAEFRNWLFKEFGLEIGFQTLLTPVMTFRVLAGTISEKLGFGQAQ